MERIINFFGVGPFVGTGYAITVSKNAFLGMSEAVTILYPTNATIFRGGSLHLRTLEMLFLGAGDTINRPWKWCSFLEAGVGVIRP